MAKAKSIRTRDMTQAEFHRALRRHGVEHHPGGKYLIRTGDGWTHWIKHIVPIGSRRRQLAAILKAQASVLELRERDQQVRAHSTRAERDADLLVACERGYRGREAVAFADGAAYRDHPGYAKERQRVLAEQAKQVADAVVGPAPELFKLRAGVHSGLYTRAQLERKFATGLINAAALGSALDAGPGEVPRG